MSDLMQKVSEWWQSVINTNTWNWEKISQYSEDFLGYYTTENCLRVVLIASAMFGIWASLLLTSEILGRSLRSSNTLRSQGIGLWLGVMHERLREMLPLLTSEAEHKERLAAAARARQRIRQ